MSSKHQIISLLGVLKERESQNSKWGEQNHEFPMWLTILQEEIGECAKSYLDCTHPKPSDDPDDARKNLKKEMIQVAAVALAMVECGIRNNWYLD